MKEKFKILKKDRVCHLGLSLSLAVLLFSLIFLIFHWQNLPPQIPLFYSRPWGEEQLGTPFFLLSLPSFSLLILAFHTFWATKYYSSEALLARILIWIATSFCLLATITLVKIINLVT